MIGDNYYMADKIPVNKIVIRTPIAIETKIIILVNDFSFRSNRTVLNRPYFFSFSNVL
jgi:hypothetical protein